MSGVVQKGAQIQIRGISRVRVTYAKMASIDKQK